MTYAELMLHTPESATRLASYYERAFANAVELYMVTAYLTDWNEELVLNERCSRFRVIIGKDFGITRKAACRSLLGWLPGSSKGRFLVAQDIDGFHPKAVFWKEKNGECFAIIGSSNFTRAAFESNYEANVCHEISAGDFAAAKGWVKGIENRSIVVSEDWLESYHEAPRAGGKGAKGKPQRPAPETLLALPSPKGMQKRLRERRTQLEEYAANRAGLEKLFRRCATGKITPEKFYEDLPRYWGGEAGGRMQGSGWEIKGKHSDFKELTESYLRIVSAGDDERDDVVVEEIDRLAAREIPTRKAFLSEMLCLRFPDQYPLLNQPVEAFIRDAGFKAPRGASEGVRYLSLARQLRHSLRQSPKHPAKNLAELDTVIWLEYGDKGDS